MSLNVWPLDVLCLLWVPSPRPPLLAEQPNAGQSRLILEVSRVHTMTHNSRYGSSRRVIGSSQEPPPHNTQTTDRQTDMSPHPRKIFFILLYSVCTLFVLNSLSWFSSILSFVFTYNTQHKHLCPPAGIEPSIRASQLPQTLALGRSATRIGTVS